MFSDGVFGIGRRGRCRYDDMWSQIMPLLARFPTFAAMNPRWRHLFELNLATLILGTSGFLGKVILLPAPIIIFARSLLAFGALYIFLRWRKKTVWRDFNRRRWFFILSGLALAAHWVLYFLSIKVSIVSIAMVSVFTFPAITALLEPVFLKTRLAGVDLFNGLLVVAGLVILTPEFDLSNDHTVGVALGVVSAALFAIRNLLNKKYIAETSATAIMMMQALICAVALSPAVFIYDFSFDLQSVVFLVALALLTTAVGHTLFVYSLNHFKTSAASMIASLQPIYGTIMAILFLGEKLTVNIIAGGLLIVGSVVMASYRQYAGKGAA